jgi:hypothetical protein
MTVISRCVYEQQRTNLASKNLRRMFSMAPLREVNSGGCISNDSGNYRFDTIGQGIRPSLMLCCREERVGKNLT